MRVSTSPRSRRIERHQVLGGVDQLAVQRPVVVAADLATGGHRRVRRDAPPRQSGAVQHVLVTAPDDDHRMVRRHGVEVAPQRQALLGELRLVPVGVREHDSAGCGLAHRRRDGRQHPGERARAGQVHPRAAAGRVEVVVGQPRHHRAPAEVDHARRSRFVRTYLGSRLSGFGHPPLSGMSPTHTPTGYGIAVSVSYKRPTPQTPLGLMAPVAPSWGGQASSGAEVLWGRQTITRMAHGGFESATGSMWTSATDCRSGAAWSGRPGSALRPWSTGGTTGWAIASRGSAARVRSSSWASPRSS